MRAEPKIATFKAKWDEGYRERWGIRNTFAEELPEPVRRAGMKATLAVGASAMLAPQLGRAQALKGGRLRIACRIRRRELLQSLSCYHFQFFG